MGSEQEPSRTLLRLLVWLSPSFPTGSFAYSHALESAVHDGLVGNAQSLEDWLRQLIEFGSGWNDALIFAESWRRSREGGDLGELAELAEALAASAERHLEALMQGAAFLEAAKSWPSPVLARLPKTAPYCVAVGALAAAHGVPLAQALPAYLQTFASNAIQAGIRLSVLGQIDAVAMIAVLESPVIETARKAGCSTLDDLGSATVLSDIMAMRHETLHSRLFRS